MPARKPSSEPRRGAASAAIAVLLVAIGAPTAVMAQTVQNDAAAPMPASGLGKPAAHVVAEANAPGSTDTPLEPTQQAATPKSPVAPPMASKVELADLAAQWAMVLMALSQVALTLVGIHYIRRTLVATEEAVTEATEATGTARDAVAETRRLGEAQVRAYLCVIEARYTAEAPAGENRLFSGQVELILNNSGATPATHVRVFCGSTTTTFNATQHGPQDVEVPFANPLNAVPSATTVRETVSCFGIVPTLGAYRAALGAFDDHTPIGEAPLVLIHGAVFYQDVFGQDFRSDFAFTLEARGTEKDKRLKVAEAPRRLFVPIDAVPIQPPRDDAET